MSFPDLCTPIKTVLGFNKQNTRNNSNVDNSNVDNSSDEVILKEYNPSPILHTSNDASILDKSPINNDTYTISQLSYKDLQKQLMEYRNTGIDPDSKKYFMQLINESTKREKIRKNHIPVKSTQSLNGGSSRKSRKSKKGRKRRKKSRKKSRRQIK